MLNESQTQAPRRRYSDQHVRVSALDDHLIHQAPHVMTTPWTSDPRVFDRYWNVMWDEAGELFVAVGGGVYPNLGVCDAFAIVNSRGRHYSVRIGQPRPLDPLDITVGPYRARIEEGLKSWTFELEANDFCPTFSLTWTDEWLLPFRGPSDPKYAGGEDDVSVTAGFEAFGTATGVVNLPDGGDSSRVTLRGTRDRHWGIRLGVGGPQLLAGRAVPKGRPGWIFTDFGDWRLWGDQVMLGDKHARVRAFDRQLAFEPDTNIFQSGIIDLTFEDGTKRRLEIQKMGQQGAYLRAGAYGGPNGGAPGSDRWHGMVAEPYIEGGVDDLNDPIARTALTGLNEHHCRITCDGQTTFGVFQSYDPTAHRRCVNRVPGWRLLS
jgi:hypothetical protein